MKLFFSLALFAAFLLMFSDREARADQGAREVSDELE